MRLITNYPAELTFPHIFPDYITTPLCPPRVFEERVNFIPRRAARCKGKELEKTWKKKKQKNMTNIAFKPWRAKRKIESGFPKHWIERYYHYDVAIKSN